MTWAALEAKLREERVSVAEAASGERLQTSITLEEPHRESWSTCTAPPQGLVLASGVKILTQATIQMSLCAAAACS